MSITLDPEIETKLRARAESEGLTMEQYIERLVRADQVAEEEIEASALEGLRSGEAIEASLDYWEEKHRRLDERLKKTDA